MRAYWFDNLPGDQRLPHDSGKVVSNAHLSRLGIQYYHFPVTSSDSHDSNSNDNDNNNKTSSSTEPATTTTSSITNISSDNDDNNGNDNGNDNEPSSVDVLARSRGYANRDQVTISPAALGDAYESKVRSFFDEHLHEDEEIRYILDGSGYFDVRARPRVGAMGTVTVTATSTARAIDGDSADYGGSGGSGVFGGSVHKEEEEEEEEKEEGWIRIRLERGDLMIMPAGIYHRFTTDEANYTKAMRLFQDEPKWTPLSKSAETDTNAHRLKYLEQRDGIFVK